MPKWTAGMGNTFRYKDFDFYVFMYGMFGHTIYCDPGTAHDGRMNTRYVDYWTPENPNSHFRKPQKEMPTKPTTMLIGTTKVISYASRISRWVTACQRSLSIMPD